jgi:Concanavalin A-like lectin/glucanases superfamily
MQTVARLVLGALVAGCGDNLAPIPSCRAAAGYEIAPSSDAVLSAYDETVLGDGPVAFWRMGDPSGREPDVTGDGNDGRYDSPPPFTSMPNGDPAADFNGESLSVASNASLSIPTTGSLAWEAWMKPDSLELEHSAGYVNWLTKCPDQSSCEWEARFYDSVNSQDRCDRFSAYAFNPSGGDGAGADWQPVCGSMRECAWHYVVGQYSLSNQPADCPPSQFPGSIDIWVDGVQWNQPFHNPTGCMSQYDVSPVAGNGALEIGFDGAIGKVAIYSHVLDGSQIATHYGAMTGGSPSGACGVTCTTD